MLWKHSKVKDLSPAQRGGRADKMSAAISPARYKGVTSTLRAMGSEMGGETRWGLGRVSVYLHKKRK